eukprot:3226972-Amphidinium_carterae.1
MAELTSTSSNMHAAVEVLCGILSASAKDALIKSVPMRLTTPSRAPSCKLTSKSLQLPGDFSDVMLLAWNSSRGTDISASPRFNRRLSADAMTLAARWKLPVFFLGAFFVASSMPSAPTCSASSSCGAGTSVAATGRAEEVEAEAPVASSPSSPAEIASGR